MRPSATSPGQEQAHQQAQVEAKSAKAAADRDARLAAERMAARAQATLQAETERIRAEAAAKLEREIAELRAKAISAPPAPKMPDPTPVSDGRVQPAVDISKVRELPWKTMAMAASVVLVLGAVGARGRRASRARVAKARRAVCVQRAPLAVGARPARAAAVDARLVVVTATVSAVRRRALREHARLRVARVGRDAHVSRRASRLRVGQCTRRRGACGHAGPRSADRGGQPSGGRSDAN